VNLVLSNLSSNALPIPLLFFCYGSVPSQLPSESTAQLLVSRPVNTNDSGTHHSFDSSRIGSIKMLGRSPCISLTSSHVLGAYTPGFQVCSVLHKSRGRLLGRCIPGRRSPAGHGACKAYSFLDKGLDW